MLTCTPCNIKKYGGHKTDAPDIKPQKNRRYSKEREKVPPPTLRLTLIQGRDTMKMMPPTRC